MARTVISRTFLICFLVSCSVLGLYTLCVTLELQVPWHIVVLSSFPSNWHSDEHSSNSGQVSGGSPRPSHVLTFSTEPDNQHSSSVMITALKVQTTQNEDLPPQENTPITTTPITTTRTTITTPITTGRPSPQVSVLLGGTQDPPFIGDSYAVEEVPLQTQQCPLSLRSRVVGSQFRERFKANIPVLQWAKHATLEEYKRLQQYPGTHGWGGLDFQTVLDTLSVLNTEANRQMFDDWPQRANGSKCVRCAVVGNGGILKDSKKGEEIDQHDYVFRTNGAVTKGFEEDVGRRTTHYTFSTNTMRNSMASYRSQGYHGPPQSEETRYVFLPDHDRDYFMLKAAALNTVVERGPEMSQMASIYFGKNVSVHNVKMYHPDFVRYIRNRFLRSHTLTTKYKDIYRASTGAVMLLAALHTCDQVSAYGFMTPDYSKYSDHYFNRQYQLMGFYINHDLKMELKLWQDLHKAGILQLYMRP